MMVKVSVIVPVYNAEKYLRGCLDSIIGQTLHDIEIICVDDGSTDSSPQVLAEYAEHDSRVQVYHQRNQYAGVARNNGMSHATGEYIIFLDADDFFELDMLEETYAKAKSADADICAFSGWRYDEQRNVDIPRKKQVIPSLMQGKEVVSIEDIPEKIFQLMTWYTYNKIYRLNFLLEHDILFPNTRNSNDASFMVEALANARRITILDKKFFHYRVRSGDSLTDTVDADVRAGYDVLLSARAYLINRGVYNSGVRRSFANKSLRRMRTLFQKLHTYEGLVDLHRLLVLEGGFANLDIVPHEAGYYYREDDYDWYRTMVDAHSVDTLVFNRYIDIRKRLADVKAELYQTKKRCKATEKQIVSLRESRSYRLGKRLSALPRFVKNVMHFSRKNRL